MSTAVMQPADWLENRMRALFRAAGSAPSAKRPSSPAISSKRTCAGHDSHGVGMVPIYLRNVRDGHLRLNQTLAVLADTGAMLVCDGRQGAGQVMAHDAMELGISARGGGRQLHRRLRNSHHIGRIGHWAEQCAAGRPRFDPFRQRGERAERRAVRRHRGPARDQPVRRRASRASTGRRSSSISRRVAGRRARCESRMNKGVPVPPGTLLDAGGRPTTDPSALFGSPPGALVTFGEHKGWGLALACEILAGALPAVRSSSAAPTTAPSSTRCSR